MGEYRPHKGKTKWIVYGIRPHGRRMATAGVHKDCDSEAEAFRFAIATVLEHGHTQAVIVRLAFGEDRNGEREVIARYNGGKTWWE